VIWVFISEIFPNRHRAEGQALGSFTHWLFAALLTTFFQNSSPPSPGLRVPAVLRHDGPATHLGETVRARKLKAFHWNKCNVNWGLKRSANPAVGRWRQLGREPAVVNAANRAYEILVEHTRAGFAPCRVDNR
jgi:hypothetical protein